jgi:hypothetical protein
MAKHQSMIQYLQRSFMYDISLDILALQLCVLLPIRYDQPSLAECELSVNAG